MAYLDGLKNIANRVNRIDAKNNFNLIEIDIERLIPSTNNFYGIREIEELAESIKENGLIHNLVVRELDDGNYEILSGERRYRALMFLNYKKIPCQIKNISELDGEILLIQANSKQRELTHIEKMKGIERLKELYELKRANGEEIPKGKTRDLIGKDIGLSGVQVGRYMKVSKKLIDPLKDRLEDGGITLTQADVLSNLDEKEQGNILNQISNLDPKESKQEVDILVEGIKQPVKSKWDKELVKEIKETKQDIEIKVKDTNEDKIIEFKKILEQNNNPKVVITNPFIWGTLFTQEVKLIKDEIEVVISGGTSINVMMIKIDCIKPVDTITLFDNKQITPKRAYEVSQGIYLCFISNKEED